MELDPNIQAPLVDLAMQGLENFIADQGGFTPFALVMFNDGQIQILETSDEFPDEQSASDALLQQLLTSKREGQIVGCLLCSPVVVPSLGAHAVAILQVEGDSCEPVTLSRQILHASGTPTLADEVTSLPSTSRVF